MIGAPAYVKRKLIYPRFKHTLIRARNSVIPQAPKTFMEAALKFEQSLYPEKFQDFYKGYVSVKSRGKNVSIFIFKYCGCICI